MGMRSRGADGGVPLQGVWERNHALCWLALAVSLGVWLAPWVEPGLWPLWLIPGAVLLGAGLLLLRRSPWFACLPLAVMLALLGTQAWLHPKLPQEVSNAQITATVYGDPMPREAGRVAAMLCEVTVNGTPQSGLAYATFDAESGVTASALFDGAALRFQGSTYHPQGKQNEFDFDFRLWLLQNGVCYGIGNAQDATVLNAPDTAPWKNIAARLRGICEARLQSIMGEQSALAVAMLLGDRDALAQEEQLAFQRAGVAHLMAVSGLHVALLAGAVAWLLNLLSVRKSIRQVVTGVLIALYCALTGFSAATMRATVMLALLLLAEAVGRKPDPITTLSAAWIALLALRPLDFFSAGFTLSFSAAVGIALLYPTLRAGLMRVLPSALGVAHGAGFRGRLLRAGRSTVRLLSVSLAAQVGVLLPTAAYFHRLPLYGVAFNLVAVPLAGLLVPLYAVTLALALLPGVGLALAWLPGLVATWGSNALLWLVKLCENLPYAQVRVATPNLWAYLALGFAVVAASRYVRAGWGKRATAVALAALLAGVGAYGTRPADLRYHQLSVGQGDAALLMEGDQTVAIDVGESGTPTAERLLAEGRDLDALILTHMHTDHAMGLQALLDAGIGIRAVYLPDSARSLSPGAEGEAIEALISESGAPVHYLSAGHTLTFGRLQIDVLWPEEGASRPGLNANERSLAMLLHLGSLRILSLGDNSTLYEPYFATPCDVLKVAHHGSANGTSDDLLSRTNPSLALITCRANAALPAAQTLDELAGHGVKTLRTDETGEIILEAQDGGYRVRTYFERYGDESQ